MFMKRILLSIIILYFTSSMLDAEPRMFVMDFNKEKFNASVPIAPSKFDTTQVLFILHQLMIQVPVYVGTLEDVRKVIMNNDINSSPIPEGIINVLKHGQEHNKKLNCVYYPGVVTTSTDLYYDAVVMNTKNTGGDEYLKEFFKKKYKFDNRSTFERFKDAVYGYGRRIKDKIKNFFYGSSNKGK